MSKATATWHTPPGWPPAPTGWTPAYGWTPDPAWPPAPPGWQFWTGRPNPGLYGVPPGATKRTATSGKVVALLVVGLLLFGGCTAAVIAGSNSTQPTPSVAAEAPASPPVVNPEATDGNRSACTEASKIIADSASVFTDVGKGAALAGDAAAKAGEVQTKLRGVAGTASGDIGSTLSNLADNFGRVRVEVVTGDTGGLSVTAPLVVAEENHLVGICSGIF